MVRGVRRQGLIIDHGAASGVIGTHTLSEYMRTTLWPQGLDVTVGPSGGQFTGISGESTSGLGLATVPLGIGLPSASWQCDLLGGSASLCPGLFPLHAQRSYMCTTFTNLFENGDGVFLLRPKDENGQFLPGALYYRLLLTESGHYLWPCDDFTILQPDEQQRLRQIVREFLQCTVEPEVVSGGVDVSSVCSPAFVVQNVYETTDTPYAFAGPTTDPTEARGSVRSDEDMTNIGVVRFGAVEPNAWEHPELDDDRTIDDGEESHHSHHSVSLSDAGTVSNITAVVPAATQDPYGTVEEEEEEEDDISEECFVVYGVGLTRPDADNPHSQLSDLEYDRVGEDGLFRSDIVRGSHQTVTIARSPPNVPFMWLGPGASGLTAEQCEKNHQDRLARERQTPTPDESRPPTTGADQYGPFTRTAYYQPRVSKKKREPGENKQDKSWQEYGINALTPETWVPTQQMGSSSSGAALQPQGDAYNKAAAVASEAQMIAEAKATAARIVAHVDASGQPGTFDHRLG